MMIFIGFWFTRGSRYASSDLCYLTISSRCCTLDKYLESLDESFKKDDLHLIFFLSILNEKGQRSMIQQDLRHIDVSVHVLSCFMC